MLPDPSRNLTMSNVCCSAPSDSSARMHAQHRASTMCIYVFFYSRALPLCHAHMFRFTDRIVRMHAYVEIAHMHGSWIEKYITRGRLRQQPHDPIKEKSYTKGASLLTSFYSSSSWNRLMGSSSDSSPPHAHLQATACTGAWKNGQPHGLASQPLNLNDHLPPHLVSLLLLPRVVCQVPGGW